LGFTETWGFYSREKSTKTTTEPIILSKKRKEKKNHTLGLSLFNLALEHDAKDLSPHRVFFQSELRGEEKKSLSLSRN